MYHKLTVAGRLTRDPEMRYMPDGTAVTNLSLAVDNGWGENKHTLWFRASVWGKRAETANQYMTKGQKVLIEGTLKPDPATGNPKMFTRQDGSVSSSYEIRVDDFVFLSSRNEAAEYTGPDAPAGAPAGGGGGAPAPAIEEDDIPF